MVKSASAEQRTWNKQIDEKLKALDLIRDWLKKTFPPERKLEWSEVVMLERATHYLELAALQISHLRQTRPRQAQDAAETVRS